MATFSAKSHLPLVPFLQPVWGVREYIYETVVDTLDDPYRQGFRFFAFGGAAMSASGAAAAGNPFSMLIAFGGLAFMAHLLGKVVEPIIVKKHESKLPDIALSIHVWTAGAVLKMIVGLQLWTIINAVVAKNVPVIMGELMALVMFQTAMTIVLDDGARPERRVNASVGV